MAFPLTAHKGAFDDSAVADLSQALPELLAPVPLAVSGAVPNVGATGPLGQSQSQYYQITKAGVAALTLAAPVPGADDGKVLVFQSTTANAHTITATGLLNTGSASVNVATFAAFAGAIVRLQAFNGKWNVLSQVGITFS